MIISSLRLNLVNRGRVLVHILEYARPYTIKTIKHMHIKAFTLPPRIQNTILDVYDFCQYCCRAVCTECVCTCVCVCVCRHRMNNEATTFFFARIRDTIMINMIVELLIHIHRLPR